MHRKGLIAHDTNCKRAATEPGSGTGAGRAEAALLLPATPCTSSVPPGTSSVPLCLQLGVFCAGRRYVLGSASGWAGRSSQSSAAMPHTGWQQPVVPTVGLLTLQPFHTSAAETGPTNSQCNSSSKPQRNHAGCMGHCGWGNKSSQGSWACCVLGLVCAGSMELMVAGDRGISLACPSSCPGGFAVRISVVVL